MPILIQWTACEDHNSWFDSAVHLHMNILYGYGYALESGGCAPYFEIAYARPLKLSDIKDGIVPRLSDRIARRRFMFVGLDPSHGPVYKDSWDEFLVCLTGIFTLVK